MELALEKHERRKSSKRDKLSKSATLPAGAVLMGQPGEGFFSKIRRSFKIRKKNKYTFTQSLDVPEASDATPSFLSTSAASLKNGDSDVTKAQSISQKTSQKVSRAKKEAVLVSCKSGSYSSGIQFDHTASVEENVSDESRKAGSEQDCSVSRGASGMFTMPKDDDNDKFFEDFDPDYETLDDIRRKLQTGAKGDQSSSTTNNVANPAVAETSLQGNNGHDRKGHDGGLAISTDVGSLQENCVQSVAGAELTETSDDLYANAKVLMRKQFQRQSKSQEISHVPEQPSDELVINQVRSDSLSCTPVQFVGMEQAESSESVSPPPLPARNYSEKDIAAFQNKSDFSEDSNAGLNQNQVSTISGLESPNSNIVNPVRTSENTRIKPETIVNCRESAVIEQGPMVTLHSEQHSFQGSNCDLSDVHSNLPCSPCHLTLFLPTNSGHETTPDSTCSQTLLQNTPAKKDFKQIEDELLFIDEDPVDAHGYQPERTEKMESDENVTVTCNTSHSDSIFGNGSAAHNSLESVDNIYTAGKMECAGDVAASSTSHNKCGNDSSSHTSQASVDNTTTTDKTECAGDVAASSTSHDICRNCSASHGSLENMHDTSAKNMLLQHLPSASAVNPDTSKEAPRRKRSQEFKDKNSQKCQEKRDLNSQNLKYSALEKNSEQPCRCVGEIDSNPQPKISSESASRQSSCVSASAECSPSASSFSTPSSAEDNLQKNNDNERKSRRSIARTQSLDLSQHFLRFPEAARMMDGEPPPLPARRVTTASAAGRKAVSEELPLRCAESHGQTFESRKNRRHSSAVAAAIAHKDFLKSMKQLKECGWYWGPLNSDEAVVKLTDKCDGSFLVRDSSSDKYLLAISFKYMGQVHHTRIEYHKGLFSFWEQPDEHSKAHICQFIEQTVEDSRKGKFIYFQRQSGSNANPLPIQLLYPVSRFCRVQSLQHICRFLILRLVRRDHVDELPLPQKVKGYLLEKQYYVEMNAED